MALSHVLPGPCWVGALVVGGRSASAVNVNPEQEKLGRRSIARRCPAPDFFARRTWSRGPRCRALRPPVRTAPHLSGSRRGGTKQAEERLKFVRSKPREQSSKRISREGGLNHGPYLVPSNRSSPTPLPQTLPGPRRPNRRGPWQNFT